jgi:molecular chaperone HtpG
VAALYGQALLAGHHPLRAADTAAMNRAYLGLIDQAFAADEGSPWTHQQEGNR